MSKEKVYILKKDFGLVKAGQKVMWNPGYSKYMTWEYKHNHSECLFFTQEEIDRNPEWFQEEVKKDFASNDSFQWTDELVLMALDLAHHNGYHRFKQTCKELFNEIKVQAQRGGYKYAEWITNHVRQNPQAEITPLGIIPEWLWREMRMDELHKAITRYNIVGHDVNNEWIKEYGEHREWLHNWKENNPRSIVEASMGKGVEFSYDQNKRFEFSKESKVGIAFNDQEGKIKEVLMNNSHDWKITAFADYKNKGEYFKRDMDLYWKNGIEMVGRSEKWLLDNNYSIYSVRRLTDGEVFCVSDKDENGLTITHFKIVDGEMYAHFAPSADHDKKLSQLKKLPPQPHKLFTTEDGKDIFEGEEYWYINIGGGFPNNEYWQPIPRIAMDGKIKTGFVIKKFSTKEAAEKYIAENKPQPQKEEQRIEVIVEPHSSYADPRIKSNELLVTHSGGRGCVAISINQTSH